MLSSLQPHRAIPAVEVWGKEAFERHQTVLAFLPFGGTKGPKVQIGRSTGQRIRHVFHEQEIGRTSQKEIPRSTV